MIITPENTPDHHTVGHDFMGWKGVRYHCDSYDPSCGYWMTPKCSNCFCDEKPVLRTNVSERAIGGTFHIIYFYDFRGRELTTSGFLASLRAWEEAHQNGNCDGYTR